MHGFRNEYRLIIESAVAVHHNHVVADTNKELADMYAEPPSIMFRSNPLFPIQNLRRVKRYIDGIREGLWQEHGSA
ncbi:MAG: hypothetical protein WDM78_21640 [Puia sp.]